MPPKDDTGSDDAHASDASSGAASPKRKTAKLNPSSDNEEGESRAVASEGAASSVTVDVHTFDSEPELPPSPSDIKQSIKQKFLVEMPDDFYQFWDFCESISGSNPACKYSSHLGRLFICIP